MNAQADTFFPFYARDREHAESKAEEILEKYGYGRLDLKEYPCGFRMIMTHLPGRIEEEALHPLG